MQLDSLKNLQKSPSRAYAARLVLSFGAAIGAVFFFAGCNNRPPADPMAEAAEGGERPVAMKGATKFFDDKVDATITISRGFNRSSVFAGRGDRSRRNRQKDAADGGLSNSYPVGSYGGASESEQREMYEELVRMDRARRAAGSPMPPVTIRLILENHGADAADVEILELNSDLGNFAVRPAKISLTKDQSGETDPMVSQLGVTSDEIPIKVVLRIAGKKETQVITVKSIFTAIEKGKK